MGIPKEKFSCLVGCLLSCGALGQSPGRDLPIQAALNPKTTVIIDYVEGYEHHRPGHSAGPGGGGEDETGPDHSGGHYELIGGVWFEVAENDFTASLDPVLSFAIDLRGFPSPVESDLAIRNGFQEWENVTEGQLIGNLVSTTDVDVAVAFGDGKNTYSMRNLGGGGVLAATYITWDDADSNGTLDAGEMFLEMDVIHNYTIKWGIAGVYEPGGRWWDVGNVATHEIGHVYGLGHPGGAHQEDKIQTMYASAPAKETAKRSIECTGDIPGIQSSALGYGWTADGCSP